MKAYLGYGSWPHGGAIVKDNQSFHNPDFKGGREPEGRGCTIRDSRLVNDIVQVPKSMRDPDASLDDVYASLDRAATGSHGPFIGPLNHSANRI